ncbi:MAG: DUF58 domain-containing protein [Fimbriimonadaceae bacterium]
MGNIVGIALTTAAFFLLVVAVLLNSTALFYMSTAMAGAIVATRIQSWLAVKGLRFDRRVPEVTRVGELVTVEVLAWSERPVKRPLTLISDHLPRKLAVEDRTPALPIAPTFGEPVAARYSFRPMRRGRFRWSGVHVVGTDPFGIVATTREYETPPAELTVLPRPIPIQVDLPSSAGFGFEESEHGLSRGPGLEPRGVREYAEGDSMRYVHWRSSARAGKLLVKEFETGSQSAVSLIIQTTKGSDVGRGAHTTLERMCGHAAYLMGSMVRQGIDVRLIGVDSGPPALDPSQREWQILMGLSQLEADDPAPMSVQIRRMWHELIPGSAVYLLLAVPDEGLPDVIRDLQRNGHTVLCIVLDAASFQPDAKSPVPNAADPDFLGALRDAGAKVFVTGAAGGVQT